MDKNGSRDLLTLARTASLPELIAAIDDRQTLEEKPGALPPRANQIARLILSRAIELIRLGTQSELAEASIELVRASANLNAKGFADRFPEAHRLLTGASVTLRSATSPASSGGEMATLRGWNGNALRAVKIVGEAPAEEISRAALREQLGVSQSYISHLLAALEAAGLVVRVRDGKAVTVHRGPIARSDHVRALLDSHGDRDDDSVGAKRVRSLFESFLDNQPGGIVDLDPSIGGVEELRRQIVELRQNLSIERSEIVDLTSGENLVVAKIQVSGTYIQAGPDDGASAERPLVWAARMTNGAITSVETWTSLEGFPRSVVPAPRETLPTNEPTGYLQWDDASLISGGLGRLVSEEEIEVGEIRRFEFQGFEPATSHTEALRHLFSDAPKASMEAPRWGLPIPNQPSVTRPREPHPRGE